MARFARPAGSTLLRTGCLSAGLALGSTLPAAAQPICDFVAPTASYQQFGGVGYVGSPHLVCDDGIELWADSAVSNGNLRMHHLMGSVRIYEGSQELLADTVRYFPDSGRIQAYGNLVVTNEEDGSRIENGLLLYFRETDARDEPTMEVTPWTDGIRPVALLPPPQDSTAAPPEEPPTPYRVTGDRIELPGGDRFISVGDVEIIQDSLFAYGDSVNFDGETDELLLDGSARVVTGGNTLSGRVITIEGAGADTSRIWARRDGLLIGEGMRLTSPQILVNLAGGDLNGLVAIPFPPLLDPTIETDSLDYVRPVALVEDFELIADSVEVQTTGDLVERVFASGNARSESFARDSLNVESLDDLARSDWLEGDTVIVSFHPVDASIPEEERVAEVDEVVAIGNASSVYRLVPSDSLFVAGEDAPAVHYVSGASITITMDGDDVDAMHVEGQTRGVHLEPIPRRAAPDSAAVGDSAAARDTIGVADEAASAPQTPTPYRFQGEASGGRPPYARREENR